MKTNIEINNQNIINYIRSLGIGWLGHMIRIYLFSILGLWKNGMIRDILSLRWAGHVARMEEDRIAFKLLTCKLTSFLCK